MFLTVTPNLCIERTAHIADFRVGAVHRVAPESLGVNVGGKGINAARVASTLGAKVVATSWVGKNQRAWVEKQLRRESLAFDLVEVEADTRICLNILRDGGEKTEVVEAGNSLSISDGTRMLEKFESLLADTELVAICGSYPASGEAGTQSAFDSHLTLLSALARRRGKRVLVDGKGTAFELLLRSKFLPWAIKPNCDEAAAILKYSVADEASERRAVRDLVELGVEVVLLSCGKRGAYLGTRSSTLFFAPPRVQEVSAVGAGDSFVGAFAARFLQTNDIAEAASWGTAAGAASAAQTQSAVSRREQVEELLPEVRVEVIQSGSL